jgi:hypothetical protein
MLKKKKPLIFNPNLAIAAIRVCIEIPDLAMVARGPVMNA